jgi:hypothetical protein
MRSFMPLMPFIAGGRQFPHEARPKPKGVIVPGDPGSQGTRDLETGQLKPEFQQPKPSETFVPEQRRRGMGGIFGDGRPMGIFRRADGDPGSAINYLLFGLEGVETMRDRRMTRDMFGFRTRQAKLEEAERERQRQEIEAAIATLPPEMQPWGRLAPNEAAERALAPPPAPDWNLDPVTGQPFAITPQGQVQYGQGRVNVRPTGGGADRAPAGYRFTPDGNLQAIPGGPAATDIERRTEAQVGRLDTTDRQLSNSIDVLNDVLGLNERGEPIGPGMINERTTGQWPDRFREWGFNQDGENLYQQLEPVVANIGFEALAEMRRNSATGGALGQVAVREIELLQRTVRSLATSQGAQQLRDNATAVREQLIKVRDAVRAAREETLQMGGDGAPAGVTAEEWRAMTPEERALWQN